MDSFAIIDPGISMSALSTLKETTMASTGKGGCLTGPACFDETVSFLSLPPQAANSNSENDTIKNFIIVLVCVVNYAKAIKVKDNRKFLDVKS